MHFTNGVSFIRCKKTLASARCSTVHGLLSKELWHPSQIQGQALDSHWLTASPPTWPTSTCTDLPTPSHNSPHTYPPCLVTPFSQTQNSPEILIPWQISPYPSSSRGLERGQGKADWRREVQKERWDNPHPWKRSYQATVTERRAIVKLVLLKRWDEAGWGLWTKQWHLVI